MDKVFENGIAEEGAGGSFDTLYLDTSTTILQITALKLGESVRQLL